MIHYTRRIPSTGYILWIILSILMLARYGMSFFIRSSPIGRFLPNAHSIGRGHQSSRFFSGANWNWNVYRSSRSSRLAVIQQQDEFTTWSGTAAEIDRLRGKKITEYWLNELSKLEKPSARALLSQLNSDTLLGFEPATGPAKRGTFLDFTLQQKNQHPDKVILIRNGEFYETFGVDALMLINYSGLNPMGNKAKAGCPMKNVQQTLDGLTSAGLSVAVYEEVGDSNAAGVSKSKIKHRVLTQIVSPACTTYAYGLSLRPDDIEYRENKPIVAIMSSVSGYSVHEIWLDEERISVSDRMTLQGVRAIVEQHGYVEPVYIGSAASVVSTSLKSTQYDELSSLDSLLFVDARTEKVDGVSENDFVNTILNRVARRFEVDTSRFQVQKKPQDNNRPRPIYTSTGLQIGLFENPNVPDLVSHLLPARHYQQGGSHHQLSAKFLRNWLLHPPGIGLAEHMRQLCFQLSKLHAPLPPLQPVPLGKLVSLLRSGQANIGMFRDIRGSVASMLYMLTAQHDGYKAVVKHLFPIAVSEVGKLEMQKEAVISNCRTILNHIDAVIYANRDGADIESSSNIDSITVDPFKKIPNDFFVRNEEEFKHKVVSSIPAVADLYKQIQASASALCNAVNEEYPVDKEIVFDMFENAIMYRESKRVRGGANVGGDIDGSVSSASKDVKEIPYVDRKGSAVSKKFTTANVQRALKEYQDIVESAPDGITGILKDLCDALSAELLITIILASHWSTILTAVNAHVGHSMSQGWTLAEPIPAVQQSFDDSSGSNHVSKSKLALQGLTPYWLKRHQAKPNNVEMSGLFLLTAPNMSGKSTFMRAVLTACLLANCGLYVPALKAVVPHYDNFFLRSASYDIPKEGKSAFALEMDDVRVLLRDCTHKSLIMLDEIGKGTSARDGAALAGALLEALDCRGVTGVFATHLHELFKLPLQLTNNVQPKKMGVSFDATGAPKWTFQIESGKCTDSMALHTAREYGIDDQILHRAAELGTQYDGLWNNCAGAGADVSKNDDSKEVLVSSRPKQPTKKHYNLYTDVRPYLQSVVSAVNAGNNRTMATGASMVEPVIIEPGWQAPPSMESKHALYVLHLSRAQMPDELYVGETANISQRLQQHRQKYRAETKPAVLRAMVVNVTDKSKAQEAEMLLIRELKKAGFDIVRDSDQYHTHFST